MMNYQTNPQSAYRILFPLKKKFCLQIDIISTIDSLIAMVIQIG